MTPKERMIAAFNFEQQDDIVPLWELEFHLYREMFGREPIMGFEFDKLSETEKLKAIDYDADFLIEVAETLDHSAIRVISGYWEVAPGEPAYVWLRREEDRMRLTEQLAKRGGNRFLIMGDCPGLFSIPSGPDLDNFVDMLYEEPDKLLERADSWINNGIAYAQRMVDHGAECLLNCSDFSFNNGPFLPPKMFGKFVAPFLKRWVNHYKKKGIYTIQHSDGNLMPIMDYIVDSGVHAIQCIDPLGGMDIVSLKKEMQGKMSLIGNVNCSTLQLGTPEDVDAEVKHILEGCKYNGGFVLSGCNVIFKGIPVENYQAMLDARKKYGRFS